MAFSWANLPGKPYLTVSPVGGSLPNNGADYGPNTPGTTTSGIQEAINSLPTTGGVVYCLKGSPATHYGISSSLYNNGNFQIVVFEAGAILDFSASGTYATSDLNGPADVLVGTRRSPTEANFHDCYWFGNGTQINSSGIANEIVFAAQHGGSHSVPPIVPGYMLVVDGFTIGKIGNTAFFVGGNNYASGVTYPNQIRRVRFGRVLGTWANGQGSSHCGAGSGFVVNGSARQVIVEDAWLDTSALSYLISGCPIGQTHDVSNCFIHSNAGDTTQIVVSRGTFINGGRGSSFELQGNESGIDANQHDTHRLSLEGCLFDSGNSSLSTGGSGGGYIDDYNTNTLSTNVGYLKEVIFRRTKLVNVGANYRGHNSASVPAVVGELNFADGTLMIEDFPEYPSAGAASFKYRIPGDSGKAQAPAGSSFTFSNTFGFRVTIIISGGTVTSITINTAGTGLTGGAFLLDHGDTLVVNYSSTSRPAITLQSLS